MDVTFDPAATIRPWAIDVDLAGSTYTIPALPARDWIEATLEPGWEAVVPGLLGGDLNALEELMVDGAVGTAALRTAAQDALAAAAGLKWWTAENLTRAVVGSWVSAELTTRGVDSTTIPLGAYLHAAYHLAVSRMKPEQKMQLDAALTQPPPGMDPREWFDEDEAAANFERAMAARGRR